VNNPEKQLNGKHGAFGFSRFLQRSTTEGSLCFRGVSVSHLAALLLVPFLLVFTSCLELNVAVNFRTSTAGQVQIDAFAYRLAQGLHVVEGPDRISFPSTRAEWQALADQINGFAASPILTLNSWEGTDEDLGFRSKTVLNFSTARALESLFVVFKQKLTLLQATDGRWTVTFVPHVPRVTSADTESRKLWTALWGNLVWAFGFTPPGQPRSERKVTLAELAGDQAPAEWKLTW